MVYAKEMHKVATQVKNEKEERSRKAFEEKMKQRNEKTLEFCHSTLSRMIEDKANNGLFSLILHITKPDGEGMCTIVEHKGCYNYEYKQSLVFDTVKKVLADNGYAYITTTNNFCTYRGKYRYQDIWNDGLSLTISW